MLDNIIIRYFLYFIPNGMVFFGILLLIKNLILYIKVAKKGDPTPPKVFHKFLKEVIGGVLLFIFGGILLSLVWSKTVPATSEITAETSEVAIAGGASTESYSAAAESVPFQTNVLNQAQDIWEQLIDDNLYFEFYKENTKNGCSVTELHTQYLRSFGTSGIPPYVTFDEAFNQFQQFYNTDIFPSTQRTFAEVDESIAPLGERMTSDPSIPTEEFIVRVLACKEHPTAELLYHAGRSVHDAYVQKLMENQLGEQAENSLTVKESILLPALSSALYDNSQTKYAIPYDNIVYSFTSYRTAEIYITLTNASWADTEKKLHFLLIAEARLLSAEETYPNDSHSQDASKQKPLLYYYMAKVKHDLIGYCDPVIDSALIEELKEGSYSYSKKYLAEPNADPQFKAYCNRWLQEFGTDYNQSISGQ